MSIEGVVEGLLEFAFYYPLFMTYVWMIGAVYYFYYRENSDHRRYDNPPELKKTPPVTYLVPCHNEGDNARETVQALLEQDYPEFEIIAINDCSGDSTGEILDEIAADEPLRKGVVPANADEPVGLLCGKCTRCLDACPTQAILPGPTIDGSKCISYFTIELKDEIPTSMKGKFEDWMFGCDICQDVCPWNRFSKPHLEGKFNPHPDLLEMTKNEWEEISSEVFQKIFKKSAVKRTKFYGLKRNIDFLKDF